MKKKLLTLIVFPCLFLFNAVMAQDGPIHIAVLPFSTTSANAQAVAKDVQAVVSSCFANKDRFFLLDRAQTEKLKKELSATSDKSSLYAKVVAEQGRLANAEYIITGTLDSVSFASTSSKDVLSTTSVSSALDTKNKYTKYHGSFHLALEINKVESGRVLFSKPYVITSRDFDDNSHAVILDNMICRLTNLIQADVRNLFPPPMMVVSIDKIKKNGLPDVVLVNGGGEMFDTGKQQTACPGDEEISVASKTSAVSSMFKKAKDVFSTNKIVLDVFSPEEINTGGKIYKREKPIGQLKIISVQGDLSACSIVKGAEDIKSYMDSKKPLYVKIEKTGQ